MAVTIRLLGSPAIDRDGTPLAGPRGHKSWGLLAYLALGDVPPSRQRLVSLLFGEADDPRGVLRWNLAELRRALAGVITVGGDPVLLQVGRGHHIDVQELADDVSWSTLDPVGLGGELLEGMPFTDSPCFEAWLTAERHRIAADCRTLVYESALRMLSAGEPTLAARAAARAVELDPLDADHHTVLVASLARAGDTEQARRQVALCADLFRRELGVEPPPEVERAAREPPWHDLEADAVSSAAVRSYLDAGRAAVSAGTAPAGINQLQRAAGMAAATDDEQLTGHARLALASALIHSAGGRDAEVATLLHDALAAAERTGDPATAAASCRELGFLAVQLGQRESAGRWLRRAEGLSTDDAELAKVFGVRGMSLSDSASYLAALDAFAASIDHATRARSRRSEAWTLSMIGRVHVLRGEPSLVVTALDPALDMIRSLRWTAFLAWPETFRAEAALTVGDRETARELLDHAWVLATESDDRCWIATVAHGLTRLAAADDPDGALRWCETGLRHPIPYLWLRARLLDAGCDVARRPAPHLARRWTTDLAEIAVRGAMHEYTARAHLHRHRLGDVHALEAARSAASDIDNPSLHRLLDREGSDP